MPHGRKLNIKMYAIQYWFKKDVPILYIYKCIATWEKTHHLTRAHNNDSNKLAHSRLLISLQCPLDKTMHTRLPKKRSVKILIWLRECSDNDLNLPCEHMSEGTFSDVATEVCKAMPTSFMTWAIIEEKKWKFLPWQQNYEIIGYIYPQWQLWSSQNTFLVYLNVFECILYSPEKRLYKYTWRRTTYITLCVS